MGKRGATKREGGGQVLPIQEKKDGVQKVSPMLKGKRVTIGFEVVLIVNVGSRKF